MTTSATAIVQAIEFFPTASPSSPPLIDQLGAAYHQDARAAADDRLAWQATYASLRQWFPGMNTPAGRELAAGLFNERIRIADPAAMPAESAV